MNVIIIGNGITGVTAALGIRARQPGWSITLISGEADAFFSRPALMYIYLGHLSLRDTQPYAEDFWRRKRIARLRGWVRAIDTRAQRVELEDGRRVVYDRLLIATGSGPNRFGWPGQDLKRVQGFYSLQDLEALEQSSIGLGRAVIVGGGLIGLELAEMLHSRGVQVTLLVREPSYWANVMPRQESAILNELIREAGFDLRLGVQLKEIEDDGAGGAGAVRTDQGDRIACQLVGLTAGVSPNLSALAGSGIQTGRGVLVDRSLRTSVPNVYAAGDCAEIVLGGGERNLLEQVWYTGKNQADVVARVMSGAEARYERGVWFNSAKFIDLEWQTYGQVVCGLDEASSAGPPCLVWVHRDRRHAIRLSHRAGKIVGFNLLGLRYRHRICERWIAEGRPPEDVLDHLGEACFDPELFHRFEREAVPVLREQLR